MSNVSILSLIKHLSNRSNSQQRHQRTNSLCGGVGSTQTGNSGPGLGTIYGTAKISQKKIFVFLFAWDLPIVDMSCFVESEMGSFSTRETQKICVSNTPSNDIDKMETPKQFDDNITITCDSFLRHQDTTQDKKFGNFSISWGR